MSEKVITIASDFSRVPYGRYRSKSKTSAEAFRDDILLPALREFSQIQVVLDGTRGYGSSFLEETFGGLVRNHQFTSEELKNKLTFVSINDPTLVQEIIQYIDAASNG